MAAAFWELKGQPPSNPTPHPQAACSSASPRATCSSGSSSSDYTLPSGSSSSAGSVVADETQADLPGDSYELLSREESIRHPGRRPPRLSLHVEQLGPETVDFRSSPGGVPSPSCFSPNLPCGGHEPTTPSTPLAGRHLKDALFP